MVRWPTQTVEANGLTIHYLRTGGEKPPIVFLHGFYDNGLNGHRVAETLARDFDILLPDARFHGLTSIEQTPGFTYQDLANDTIALLEALGIQQAILMGHSMGASNAAVVAAQRPDLVRALVLEDPAWRETQDESDEHHKIEVELWKTYIQSQKDLSHEDRLEQAQFEQPLWTTDDLGPWMTAQDQFDMAVFEHIADSLQVPWRQTPWREVVARITCPSLIITGENQRGAIVTPSLASELQQINPRCQVVHIEGTGHNIRRDRFAHFMNAVTPFLKEL